MDNLNSAHSILVVVEADSRVVGLHSKLVEEGVDQPEDNHHCLASH